MESDSSGLMSPPRKRARSEAPAKKANDQSVSGLTGGGLGVPIPLTSAQGNRKIHYETIISSGTTFVKPGNDGSWDNVWAWMPWEFSRPHLSQWDILRATEDYEFWKAYNVSIEFKNPLCIQDNTVSATSISAGENAHAQLFGYVDSTYLSGVADRFGVDGQSGLSQTNVNKLIESWGNHGYVQGAPISLPTSNISYNSFQHHWPDCKQIGMGPGQAFEFGWGIHSPYWRSTNEFQFRPNSGGLYNDSCWSRWDQAKGIIGENGGGDSEGGSIKAYYMSDEYIMDGVTGSHHDWDSNDLKQGGNFLNLMNKYILYTDPEPIPRMWLHLQPQLGSIAAGTSNSICQLQWELKCKVAFTGKHPNIGRRNDVTEVDASGVYTTGRQGLDSLPIFRTVVTNYNRNYIDPTATRDEPEL